MSVPMPFGQFVPGDSPVHRLDPRVKLVLAAAFTVLVFAVHGWIRLAVPALLAVIALVFSGVPPRLALRGLKPVALLLLFTVAVNALRLHSSSALVSVGPLGVDASGLSTGLFFSARIVLIVVSTSLVTLTTSPVALTDALARLMSGLRVFRFPVDDVAMMFSIALRFIPTTAEEAEKITLAQTARGARFNEGGPVRRAKAWVPVLIPLFVNLFRRADDLALAMESRCYTGEGRTRLHQPHMRTVDWIILASGVAVLMAAVVL
ncbi:MAG: energy-coupling factor transporter transmembrane protein EcfT [Coriobacteriia bacterium]|nr:energy-coupling factor transporter transmembrane protein EcfT [Coriobacteriia bacterium]